MVDVIYIEREVQSHFRSQRICERFPKAQQILIDRYTEVFNPKAQSFRIQKQNPALILACKQDKYVLPVPDAYGTGGDKHYYFSHMLNCVYDCRYCFLQGMYRSAHYLVFVNFEAFTEHIEQMIISDPEAEQWFFSGYDCDSLAFEPVTGFARESVPLFAKYPKARMELRTKSTQVRSLMDMQPLKNVIVAYSLNPPSVAESLEYGAPSFEKRLQAMQMLQQQGWPLGVRFDPLIWHQGYRRHYADMIHRVFEVIRPETIHSVTLGVFRLPKGFYKGIANLYPGEWLFAAGLSENEGTVSYRKQIEDEMISFCESLILQYLPSEKLFSYPVYTHE